MPIDQLAGTDTEAKPDDLRADIAAQYDAMEGGNEPSEPSPSVSETEPVQSSVAEKTDSDVGKDDRPRNPDGTFKPKSEAAPEKAAPVTETPATDKAAVTEAQAQPVADAPPAGWPADAKAEWSKLSPALKAAVIKRETEISEGGRQWSEQRRSYERVLSPLAQEAARLGISTEQGLQALLAAHHALNRDPYSALSHLCKQYGVDPATLLAGQVPSSSEVSRETALNDPDASALKRQVSALVSQYLQPVISPLQERMAAEDQRQQETTLHTVTAFAQAAGHEHFDAVQEELMALIPRIKAANPGWSPGQVLQDAYDRSVYANPTTRAAVLAARETTAEEQRRAAARAHANGARRAASSVTGAAPGAPAAGAKDSLREEIMAAMAGGG